MLGTEGQIEAFIKGHEPPELAYSLDGDCMAINVLQADDEGTLAFMRAELGRRFPEVRLICGIRRYADGKVRIVRLRINRFTGSKL